MRRVAPPVLEPRHALPHDVCLNRVPAFDVWNLDRHVDNPLFVRREWLPEVAAKVVEPHVTPILGTKVIRQPEWRVVGAGHERNARSIDHAHGDTNGSAA